MSRKQSTRVAGYQGRQGSTLRDILAVLLFTAFVAGGIFFGFVFLSRVNSTAAAFGQLIGLPLMPSVYSKGGPDWAAKERVNILLLGIDHRSDEGDSPARTDTMILVTIDPFSNSVGMLSIPRDLWVPIPLGAGNVIYDRINTASVYGEINDYPGGGVALAEETVEYNLGIRVHYYALTDFQGFEEIVDAVGGVNIELDEPLVDYQYPTPDYDTTTIYIPKGRQHLDGEKALWYVRSRHQDSDFGRMKRQQKFLVALRDQLLRPETVPKIPLLLGLLADSIKTDMSAADIVSLIKLGQGIYFSSAIVRSIEPPYVTPIITYGGANVLLMDRGAMAELIGEVFFDPQLQSEAARIEVLNGTLRAGLAVKAAAYLESNGFKNVTYGNAAANVDYPHSMLMDLSGKPYSAGLAAKLLGISNENRKSQRDPKADVDIRIILGEDATLPGS